MKGARIHIAAEERYSVLLRTGRVKSRNPLADEAASRQFVFELPVYAYPNGWNVVERLSTVVAATL